MEFDYECVKLEQHDGISWLYMHRPEKKNAMSPQLHYEMDEALARLEGDPETKLVVLTGSGGNFSAGQDLGLFFRALEDIWNYHEKPQWKRMTRIKGPKKGQIRGIPGV